MQTTTLLDVVEDNSLSQTWIVWNTLMNGSPTPHMVELMTIIASDYVTFTLNRISEID